MDTAEIARAENFAALVGISPRRVHQLAERGVLRRGATVGEWVQAYCTNLAATRGKREGPEELREARTRLARAQAERYEWRNEHMRAELHPAAEIDQLRAWALGRMGEITAAVPAAVLRQAPHLAQDLGPLRQALKQIAALIEPARNEP